MLQGCKTESRCTTLMGLWELFPKGPKLHQDEEQEGKKRRGESEGTQEGRLKMTQIKLEDRGSALSAWL